MNTDSSTSSIFQTRWTLIQAAQGTNTEARNVIEKVIRLYQPAIVGAIRRHGVNRTESEDLCQEFLVKKFLSKTLPRADRSRGRFRTFLLHSIRHFIIDWHRGLAAEKRGGNRVSSLEDLSFGEEASALAFEEPRAELDFELDFAHCLHTKVLAELELKYSGRSRRAIFEALCPHILETNAKMYQQLAVQFEMAEDTIRQKLRRLRIDYGKLIRSHVAAITDPDDNPEEEAIHLMKLELARSRMLGATPPGKFE
jgi:RNA polymerase sigma factor (sigma-70 family)